MSFSNLTNGWRNDNGPANVAARIKRRKNNRQRINMFSEGKKIPIIPIPIIPIIGQKMSVPGNLNPDRILYKT